MQTQRILAVIHAIEAIKRKPPELATITFFGAHDYWHFRAVIDARTCDVCERLDRRTFDGIHTREDFPYLEIEDENTIKANVHPNCRCYLFRVITRRETVTHR